MASKIEALHEYLHAGLSTLARLSKGNQQVESADIKAVIRSDDLDRLYSAAAEDAQRIRRRSDAIKAVDSAYEMFRDLLKFRYADLSPMSDESWDMWKQFCMGMSDRLEVLRKYRFDEVMDNSDEFEDESKPAVADTPMSDFLAPAEWRRLHETQVGQGLPKTSWRRFKERMAGEDHPAKGNKLVRFPVAKLNEAGFKVAAPPQGTT